VETGVRQLPGSLDAALTCLEEDEVVQSALGETLYDRFIEAKRAEFQEYSMQVTQWELDRYLPTV